MLSGGGKARTEIRGQSSHTDPDEEVLLLNFGIFTTSSCLLCGCWRSHIHTRTMCSLLLSLSVIKLCNFQRNQKDTFFSTALLLQGWWYSNVWTILCAFLLLLCVESVKQTHKAWRKTGHFCLETTMCSGNLVEGDSLRGALYWSLNWSWPDTVTVTCLCPKLFFKQRCFGLTLKKLLVSCVKPGRDVFMRNH